MKMLGYTLIEILIALSVFAILAVITSMAMHNAFETRARLNAHAERLNALQLAISIVERDSEQAINRPVRTTNMAIKPAFIGDNESFEFTRSGFVNPAAMETRSTLKRIAYQCLGKQLIRKSWAQLDQPTAKPLFEKVLIDDLEDCSFSYLARNRQILSEWRGNALQQNQKQETPMVQ